MPPLFEEPKAIVGMIHVGALPGTPRCCEPLSAVIARAREEARAYARAGLDGLMIENMHDVPYLMGEVGPEIIAAMTAVGLAVQDECSQVRERMQGPVEARGDRGLSHQRQDQGAREDSRTSTPGHETVATPLPLGVQILAAANRAALAVALAVGAAFVRVENFVYAHVADEGLMPVAEAGPLLRYRRQIGAEHVKIVADVKKKHSSHAITADLSLADAARTTEFFGADAIVVSGGATGQPTSPEDAAAVRNAVRIPVCVGSGLTPGNLPALWPHGDVFIVGSYFKRDGLWSNPVDTERVAALMAAVTRLRQER